MLLHVCDIPPAMASQASSMLTKSGLGLEEGAVGSGGEGILHFTPALPARSALHSTMSQMP